MLFVKQGGAVTQAAYSYPIEGDLLTIYSRAIGMQSLSCNRDRYALMLWHFGLQCGQLQGHFPGRKRYLSSGVDE